MRFPGSCHTLEETKRISRILELTQLIALHPRAHLRRELATRFEVSERMIQKDLDVIRHRLKIPLSHSPQGYFFEETLRVPSLRLTFPEALSLWLAVDAGRQLHGLQSPELYGALGRLKALFPPDFCEFLNQADTRSSHVPSTVPGEHRGQMLMFLSQALARHRKVSLVYRTLSRGGQVGKRTVRPYHLMPYVRSWQLIAYCENREKVLMFKVDRILEASFIDEYFQIPEDFNIDDYLGMAWGIIRGEAADPERVVLRFDPEAGRRVSEEFWHKSQRAEELPDGRFLFQVEAVITPELVNWILYYGSQVAVLEPISLRKKVAAEHAAAARNGYRSYHGTDSGI